jgi:hypothetical protein
MKTINLPKIFKPFYCDDLIRLGKNNDGGYIVNKSDIKKTQKLLSFGIKDDWSFEEDFYKINSCSIDAYDGTINSDDELKLKSFFNESKKYFSKNIGNKENEIKFSSIILDSCFLKCDIEGSEYDILDDIILNSYKITGMVIEFHDIEKYDNFNNLTNFISKINQKLIHVHINNWMYFETPNGFLPSVVELTFSSSDNLIYKEVDLPNKLDMPNCPDREDFKIYF